MLVSLRYHSTMSNSDQIELRNFYPFVDRSNEHYLLDLLRVGPNKPLGYLGLSQLENDCKVDVNQLINYLGQNGLDVRVFGPNNTWVFAGAIFVFHKESLQAILDSNVELLQRNNWPKLADRFVERVASEIVSRKQNFKLFSLIALCFSNEANIVRNDGFDLLRNIKPKFFSRIIKLFVG